VAAEIAWRWSFGVAAGALVTVAVMRFLNSLTVTDADLLALRSRVPALMADALVHIFQGTGPGMLRLLLILTPAISVLWILAASVGRAATLRVLIQDAPASFTKRNDLRSLLGTHLLRVLVTLLALMAMAGSAILAGFAANITEDPSILLFNLVFLGLLFLVSLCWSTLSWYLSLAPIFVVRDNRPTFAAVNDAVHLVRRRGGDFSGVSMLYGLVKLFLIGVATVVSLVPLAFIAEWPWQVTTALFVIITLAYFALADLLYLARLASYLAIGELERAPAAETVSKPAPVPPVPASSSAASAPAPSEPAGPVSG
jgi:hypothetical protein